jgi:hypothetical protein
MQCQEAQVEMEVQVVAVEHKEVVQVDQEIHLQFHQRKELLVVMAHLADTRLAEVVAVLAQ